MLKPSRSHRESNFTSLNITEMFKIGKQTDKKVCEYFHIHIYVYSIKPSIYCGICYVSDVIITWHQNLPEGLCKLPSRSCSGKLRAAMTGCGWLEKKTVVLREAGRVIYKALVLWLWVF